MKKIIETDIQIRFADIDGLGHVNNAHLQQYFDQGKMDFYKRVLGKTVEPDSESIILVSVCTNYFLQTKLYDDIYVETALEKIGTKSITFYQRVVDRKTAEVKADCRTVAVAFNFETQLSMELKDEWKAAMREYLQ